MKNFTPALTKGLACALALLLCAQVAGSPIAFAQDPNSTQAAAPAERATAEVTIPDGTEFEVVTIEEISSRTATEGDPLTLRVADDVLINGHVVIAKDTIVKATVSNVVQRGRMGRGGQLGIRIETTTTVDGQRLKLRATRNNAGGDTTGSTIALSVLISPLFLLRRGNHARIRPGTRIKVYTDEDKTVRVAANS